MKKVTVMAVWCDYWNPERTYCPYTGMLHDSKTDEYIEQASWDSTLARAARDADVEDGDEIEIIVRRTGRRPFGDRKIVRTEPHEYKREP